MSFQKWIKDLSLILIISSSATAQTSNQQDYVPGQYLIKFKSTQSKNTALAKLNVTKINQPTNTFDLVEVKSDGLNLDYAKELLVKGDVEYIEPNYIYKSSVVPNEANMFNLWGLNNYGQQGGRSDVDIDAPEAWDVTTGSNTVIVGVVDTGIDYNHIDLVNNIWTNPNEIANNGIDDDANGYVDDIHGMNAINNSGNPMDDENHGTHCAGTIGASGNNNLGIVGVNWNVKLVGLKFLDGNGSGTTSDAIKAIDYAINLKQRGINIRALNNSWGGSGFSSALQDAIIRAKNVGILFLAAAGNESSNNDNTASYPANYKISNVISVAAIDRNGNLASFSNYGTQSVDVAAPGVSIISTIRGNQYAYYNGTSMATPHVTGLAALILSHLPNLTVQELRSRIIGTVKPLQSLTGVIKYPGIVSGLNAINNTPTVSTPSSVKYTSAGQSLSEETELGDLVLNTDDGYAAVNLPFEFPYYQEKFSRIYVSANGRVLPATTNEPTPTLQDFANSAYPGISIYNDDFYPSRTNGGVYANVNSERAIITWRVTPYAFRSLTSGTHDLIFQMIIKPDASIVFNFIDTTAGNSVYDSGATATTGIFPLTSSNGDSLDINNNTLSESVVGTGSSLIINAEVVPGYNPAPGQGGNEKIILEPISTVVRPEVDFDADGISDIAVYRPARGIFYALRSSVNYNLGNQLSVSLGGRANDQPFIGNIDKHGGSDFIVYSPSRKAWLVRESGKGYKKVRTIKYHKKSTNPFVTDIDGDGRSDLGLYDGRTGIITFARASKKFSSKKKDTRRIFVGTGSIKLMRGNMLGYGADQIAVFNRINGNWSIIDGSNRTIFSTNFGQAGDEALFCPWAEDADGLADMTVVRDGGLSGLNWITSKTSTGQTSSINYGSAGDTPICGRNYGGEQSIAVFRQSSGLWRLLTPSGVREISFGQAGDLAL